MVRLLQETVYGFMDGFVAFNPTMVRLLRGEVLLQLQPALHFQSHNGAIAAAIKVDGGTLMHYFQSHNGAIAA